MLGTLAIAYTMLDRAADAQAAIGTALELVSAAEDVSLQATIYHQASYIAYVAGDAQRAGRMAAAASRLALEARNHRLAVRSFSIRYSIAAGLEDDPERALEYLDAMIASAPRKPATTPCSSTRWPASSTSRPNAATTPRSR